MEVECEVGGLARQPDESFRGATGEAFSNCPRQHQPCTSQTLSPRIRLAVLAGCTKTIPYKEVALQMSSHSTSLPIRPVLPKPSEPFRFLDLPGEIRNKIYENVLCSVVPREQTSKEGYEIHRADKLRLFEEEPPNYITYLRHSIEPQILRTCRSVYDEATYIMRKTNCFVKVTIRIPDHDLEYILRGIPILYTTRNRTNGFKQPIMIHEIVDMSAFPERERSFIILHRDLGLFCKGLAEYNILKPDNDSFHDLKLVDPYESQPLPDAPKFLTRKLQESLLAPYRKLRGFSHFTIKGAVAKDLGRATVSEITGSWIGTDPELVIAELSELKSKGNDFFRAGATELASNTYQLGVKKVISLVHTPERKRIRRIGGPDFVNRVASLLFDFNSNSAQNMLKTMRMNYTDLPFEAQLHVQDVFYNTIEGCHIARYPGSTWMPSPQQMGKVFYRESAASRIFGNLERARDAINSAMDHIPDDVELQREKERILRAMR
jgi:hypothetical protein